jgi:hypothetical protein
MPDCAPLSMEESENGYCSKGAEGTTIEYVGSTNELVSKLLSDT